MTDIRTLDAKVDALASRVGFKLNQDGGQISGDVQINGNLIVAPQATDTSPNLTCEGDLQVWGIGCVVGCWKGAPTGRTATARSVDPDLAISGLGPNGSVWKVDAYLDFGSSGTSGIAFGWNVPTGSNGRWGYGWGNSQTGNSNTWGTAVAVPGTTGVNQGIHCTGTLFPGATGNFNLSWAVTVSGVNGNLNLGSYLVVTRIG